MNVLGVLQSHASMFGLKWRHPLRIRNDGRLTITIEEPVRLVQILDIQAPLLAILTKLTEG